MTEISTDSQFISNHLRYPYIYIYALLCIIPTSVYQLTFIDSISDVLMFRSGISGVQVFEFAAGNGYAQEIEFRGLLDGLIMGKSQHHNENRVQGNGVIVVHGERCWVRKSGQVVFFFGSRSNQRGETEKHSKGRTFSARHTRLLMFSWPLGVFHCFSMVKLAPHGPCGCFFGDVK